MNNNLLKYIKKYSDISIEEKDVTEVDILIFSQIPYLDLNNVFKKNDECIKLSDLWNLAINQNLKSKGLSQKNAFKIMDIISKEKRYKDLILKNYEYVLEEDTQFGAITVVTPNNKIYVAFEGTDTTLWGWKEDFKLTYIYPTPSQTLAAKYLNNTIKILGQEVIVCGHSKGGNLALVGSMKVNFFKKHKIKKIYSFDGPGLKEKEFKSLNYKIIRKKLINIIPNKSLVGILLEQENIKVIKSRGIGLFQHDPMTWQIEDTKLKPDVQDKISKILDETINDWLSKHNYKEREEIIEGVFGVLEKANVQDFSTIKENKLEVIQNIVKEAIDMDDETKKVILMSIKLLMTDISTDIINDSKKELKELEEKYIETKEKIKKHIDNIKL